MPKSKNRTKKPLICIVLFCFLLQILYPINTNAAWFNGDWASREKITIPATNVAGTLSEFPVYLDLSTLPSGFFTDVNGTGADIRMTRNDEITETSFELVNLDTVNGTGELWFKAVSLSSSSDNDFYIYYDNPAASAYAVTDPYGAHDVWSNGYLSVWHMNEDPSTTNAKDSTVNNHDAVPQVAMTSTDLVAGKIGKSIDLDGSDDYLLINNDYTQVGEIHTDVTICGWTHPDSFTNRVEPMLTSTYDGGAGQTNVTFGTGYGMGTGIATPGRVSSGYWDSTWRSTADAGTIASTNNWHYLCGTYDGATVRSYYEGVLDSTEVRSISPLPTNGPTGTWHMGRRSWIDNTAYMLDGEIDEVSLSNKTRPDTWIQTSYTNQNAPTTFVGINILNFNGTDWTNSHKITIPHGLVDVDLTDFPVYVNLADLPASFFATVNGTGADIRMTLADQITEAPYELVAIDTVNGTGELWFKAPTLSSTVDTDFYLWYGNTVANAYPSSFEFGSQNVWTNGYYGVWHLNEEGNSTVNGYQDSTANNQDITGTSMTAVSDVAGQLGKAQFTDGVADYMRITNFVNYSSFTTGYSISTWIKTATNAHIDNHFAGATWESVTLRQNLLYHNTSNALGTRVTVAPAINLNDNEWHYITGQWTGTQVQHYQDGNLAASSASASVPHNTSSRLTSIGAQLGGPTTYYAGNYDEIRISDTDRSAGWIKTEYYNQNKAENFYLIDNGDIDPSEWTQSYKITIPASEVNGDQTDFPVHLSLSDLPLSFFATVDANGVDMRMTENDATSQIAFELVDIDSTEQTGELWFKAPFLSSSLDNDFYVYAGKAGATTFPDGHSFGKHEVWSNGYVAVYHMNEDPTGTIFDSTSSSNNGSSVGSMTTSDLVSGQIGKSIDFDGVNDYINFGSFSYGAEFTTSYWLKPGDLSGTQVTLAKKVSDPLESIQQVLNSNSIFSRVFSADDVFIGREANSQINTRWQFLSTVYDGGTTNSAVKIYRNDEQVDDSDNSAGVFTSFNDLAIATTLGAQNINSGASTHINSLIDEVRISNKERDFDWIATEFSSQNAPGNFYLVENGDSAGFDQVFWSNYHKITVPASIVNGDLENFPIYVDLSDLPASFFSTVDSAGDDIRITTSDQETQTAFELVNIDTVNGSGELWFKAPTLSSTTDTDFYLWFGNPSAEAYRRNDEFGSENVWTEGYLAVWHLNDDPSSSNAIDSTRNKYDGSPVSMTAGSLIDNGQLGKSMEFDGFNDYFSLGTDISTALSNQSFSIGSWSQRGSNTERDFEFGRITLGPTHQALLWGYQETHDYVFSFWLNDLDSSATTHTATGEWKKWNGTYDVSTNDRRMYLNGQLDSNNIAAADLSGTGPYAIGCAAVTPPTNYCFDGVMDELRVSLAVRSADWIETEYYNQNGPNDFYLIDNGVLDFTQWSSRTRITIPATEVNGDQTNFPLYLNISDLPDDFFSSVNGSGADIRMTRNDGMTQIAFELVSIDTTNETGEIWFKAPSLSSSIDNEFFIYAGNANGEAYEDYNTFGTHNVWSNGYEVVWHLEENGNILADGYKDSTNNERHGTGISMTTDSDLKGQLGKGQLLDGSADYIRGSFSNGAYSKATFSAWIKDNGSGVADRFFSVGDSVNRGIDVRRAGSNNLDVIVGTTGFDFDSFTTTTAYDVDDYTNVTVVMNGTTVDYYIDGIEVSTSRFINAAGFSGTASDSDFITAGGNTVAPPNASLLGDIEIDELKLILKTKTAGWINTEYNNQSAPGNFYLVSNGDVAGFDQTLWSNYHKITIPASIIDSDLENFPVYVDLSDLPASFFSTVDSAGADIRMTLPDFSTQTAFELVELDTVNGTGELWFKAPTLSSSIDNDFYIWYGNSNAQGYDRHDEFGSENVWTENYAAVWHLNEDGNTSDNGYLDSTANLNHANGVSMTTASDVTGQLGKGQYFDGVVDTLYEPDLDLSNTNEVTVSFWNNIPNFTNSTEQTLFHFTTDLNVHTDGFVVEYSSIICATSAVAAIRGNVGHNAHCYDRPTANNWNYTAAIFDKSTANPETALYYNAQEEAIISSPLTSNNTNNFGNRPLYIMSEALSQDYEEGTLDEIHISDIRRSPDWIEAEYLNQKGTEEFYYVDNGGIFDNTQWSTRYKITIPASEVNGDVSEFPVYLNLSDMPDGFYSTVNGTGADIRITENDGTSLTPIELVSIDTTAETGEIWFRADLSSSTDNDFYIYSGNANGKALGGINPFGRHEVWSNGYVAVYHMNEDPTGIILDSTAFNNDGSSAGAMTSDDLVSGQVGKSLDFDGSNDLIAIPDSTSLSITGNLTTSAWLKRDSLNRAETIVDKQTNSYSSYIHTDDYAYLAKTTAGNLANSSPTIVPNNDWVHYSSSKIGSSSSMYLNGQSAYTFELNLTFDDTASSLYLGGRVMGPTNMLLGKLDEVRIANKPRLADWVFNEHSNQNSPGNFYLVDNGNVAGFDSSLWSDNHKITIPSYVLNGDLNNFPIYVDLSDLPPSFFSTVNGTGADIRITLPDFSTQAAYELVELDTVNGTGELWFKVPTLSSTIDNDFYIWYGNSNAQGYDRHDEFGSENVWTEDYAAVYHMNQDPSGGADAIIDSTSYRRHGTSSGAMTSSDLVSGILNDGIDFDGSNDYIALGDLSVADAASFMYSGWFKTLANSVENRIMMSESTTLSDTPVNNLYVNMDGSARAQLRNISSTSGIIIGGTSLNDNGSHYAAYSQIASNDRELYLDGEFISSNATNVTGVDLNKAQIGNVDRSANSAHFDGILDEIHFTNTDRSVDWIAAEYLNQKSTGSFYMVDNGDIDNSLWSSHYRIRIKAAEVNGDQTNFPVYIDLDDMPTDFFSTVNGTGADIRITLANQTTQTQHELVSIDTVNGGGELWFKAPFLSDTIDTDFYIHFGKADAKTYPRDHLFGTEYVWTNGYVAVWHMNEDPTGGTILDSTRFVNHGTPGGGMTTTDLVTGTLGRAIDFDGGDDSITINADTEFEFGTGNYSMSSIFTPGTVVYGGSDQGTIVSKEHNGFESMVYQGNNNQYAGSAVVGLQGNTVLAISTTYFSTQERLGTTLENYIDGFLDATGTSSLNVSNPGVAVIIGDRPGAPAFYFDGVIDELRVSRKSRSADWIHTEYNNQKSPNSFYNIGNPQSYGIFFSP